MILSFNFTACILTILQWVTLSRTVLQRLPRPVRLPTPASQWQELPHTGRRCGEEGHRVADCTQERVITSRKYDETGPRFSAATAASLVTPLSGANSQRRKKKAMVASAAILVELLLRLAAGILVLEPLLAQEMVGRLLPRLPPPLLELGRKSLLAANPKEVGRTTVL